MSRDYFAFFDLPRNLTIDPKDLEKRFYALSRELHPDRFVRKNEAERERALRDSATLNDAYRTLREPVSRAMYLLKLEGFDLAGQGAKDVPPELLEEVFELNMMAEEEDPALPAHLAGMRDAADADLLKHSADWDATHSREALTAIRAALNRRKYITNLIDKTHVPDRV